MEDPFQLAAQTLLIEAEGGLALAVKTRGYGSFEYQNPPRPPWRPRRGQFRNAFLILLCHFVGESPPRRFLFALRGCATKINRPHVAVHRHSPRAVQILSALGAGGMGEVYRAHDTRFGRDVAIKVIAERFAADSERLRRFEHEARAIAALNHPHICQLYDIGSGYLVLEYIAGRPILVRADPRRTGVTSGLASGQRAGGGAPPWHPAPRPEADEHHGHAGRKAKLLDFGLAKLASTDTDDTRTLRRCGAGHACLHVAGAGPGPVTRCAFRRLQFWRRIVRDALGSSCLQRKFDGRCAECRGARRPTAHPGAARAGAYRQAMPGQTAGAAFSVDGRTAGGARIRPGGVVLETCQYQPSIAVLPFANISSDKENEFFGDGLAEEDHQRAGGGSRPEGRSAHLVVFFRGKDVEFGEIGRRLSVEHILEGSVRKAGNRIRVTAQLIKVADGFHLWSERYDRELTDIFVIQDEITQAIAAALRIRLSPEAAPLRRHPPNLRAYAAYLEARDHWVRPTPESLTRVKQCLEHAIALDPEFALAYSLLGGHYTMLANLGFRPAREVIPLARAAEEEALRIDPSLPEAHALLGVCPAPTTTGTKRNGNGTWRWFTNPFHATFASGTGTITCCRLAA